MHNPLYKEFGNRLAELRKLKGFTQAEIALKLNTVQSTYSGYELGTRKITLELIKELSKIFDVSPDFLILGKEINPTYSLDRDSQLGLTCEEIQVITAYRRADFKDKNIARQALDLPVLQREAPAVEASTVLDRRSAV